MKQAIIVNESLKLPRGKLAAQAAHASVSAFLSAHPNERRAWLEEGMPKVVLAVSDEQEVIQHYQEALAANLPAQLIRDAGKTVVAAGTITCAGIGPARDSDIDQITGLLKLVR